MAKVAKLGAVQKEVLRGMVDYTRDGSWREYGGWNWTTTGETKRMMLKLEERGLVERVERAEGVMGLMFRITPEGRKVIGAEQ